MSKVRTRSASESLYNCPVNLKRLRKVNLGHRPHRHVSRMTSSISVLRMWDQVSRASAPVRLFQTFRRANERRFDTTAYSNSMKLSTRGAILATAVAVAFIANPARAEDFSSTPQPTLIGYLGC